MPSGRADTTVVCAIVEMAERAGWESYQDLGGELCELLSTACF